MPWRIGAERGDPSQQLRDRCVPSFLMEYCQWGLRTIAPGGFGTGGPNICREWKWSNCLCSPARHLSHVSKDLSLRRVKRPKACSAGVIAWDWMAWITMSISAVETEASEKSKSGYRTAAMALTSETAREWLWSMSVGKSGWNKLCSATAFHSAREDSLRSGANSTSMFAARSS